MKRILETDKGPLELVEDIPTDWKGNLLQGAEPLYYTGHLGSIFIQVLKTSKFKLSFSQFNFIQDIKLFTKLGENLQSLLSLKGSLTHTLPNNQQLQLGDRQFLLFKGIKGQSATIVNPGQEIQLVHTSYTDELYKPWKDLFPAIQSLKKQDTQTNLLTQNALPAHALVHEAIKAHFYSYFKDPEWVRGYLELRIREILFTLLVQSHDQPGEKMLTPQQQEYAENVYKIITADLRLHYTNKQLARMVRIDQKELKMIFKKRYGVGMYELVKILKMQKAKELALQGLNAKSIAGIIGYKMDQSLREEFKKYYGCTITEFQKSHLH